MSKAEDVTPLAAPWRELVDLAESLKCKTSRIANAVIDQDGHDHFLNFYKTIIKFCCLYYLVLQINR